MEQKQNGNIKVKVKMKSIISEWTRKMCNGQRYKHKDIEGGKNSYLQRIYNVYCI